MGDNRYATMVMIAAVLFSYAVKGGVSSAIDAVRLVNGSSELRGRVEVLYNGVWGTVCDDNFIDNANAARVVCKTLGYPSDHAVPRDGGYFGTGTGPITLDNVVCRGNEASLNECESSNWPEHSCRHDQDVGVACDGGLSITVVGIILVGGQTVTEGRLKVLSRGVWGTVCNTGFNNHTASVICSLLGFQTPGIVARGSDFFGNSTAPILLDGLICHGNKTSLNDCQDRPIHTSTCDRSKDVGVVCARRKIEEVRLVNGDNEREGRVEVLSEGVWGTVCDDGFNDNAARVVCAMLGLPLNEISGAVQQDSAVFGRGTLPILLDGVTCAGNEETLDECKHKPIADHNCDHSEDVGVVCRAQRQIEQVRLVNGDKQREGRVEVLSEGAWGTVCDDYFNDNAARVVCSMLRYRNVSYALAWKRSSWHNDAPFGQGTGLVMTVYCLGNESSLNDCQHRVVSSGICGHGEDVGAGCYDVKPPNMTPRPKPEITNIPESTGTVEETTPYGKGQAGDWENKSNDDDDGKGVIIGAVVGSLIAVILIVAVVTVLILRRRRQKKTQDDIHDPSKSSSILDCCLICDCT